MIEHLFRQYRADHIYFVGQGAAVGVQVKAVAGFKLLQIIEHRPQRQTAVSRKNAVRAHTADRQRGVFHDTDSPVERRVVGSLENRQIDVDFRNVYVADDGFIVERGIKVASSAAVVVLHLLNDFIALIIGQLRNLFSVFGYLPVGFRLVYHRNHNRNKTDKQAEENKDERNNETDNFLFHIN